MKKIFVVLLITTIALFSVACSTDTQNESAYVAESSSTAIDVTTSEIEGELELKLTVCRSIDYLNAIEADHFYASDEKGCIYKLKYDGDTSIVSEGIEIYVKVNNVKAIEFNTPVLNQWVFQYEANVEYLGLIAKPYK